MIKEIMKQIYDWISGLPGWVKAISGCLTGIIVIVTTLQEHFKLLVVVTILFILIFFAIILFIIAFAKKKSSYGDVSIYKYPRHRQRGLYGGVAMIAVLCLLGSLQPSRSFFMAPFLASDTVAEKIEVVEIRLPRVPPKQAEIVIGEFKISNSLGTIEVAQRIKHELEEWLANYKSHSEIKILKLDSVINDENKATEIALAHKAKAVIWGWVDAGDISINVLMPAPARPLSYSNPETHLSIAAPERFEGTLKLIREDVTSNITFLSLYILGYQFYLSNHYRQGLSILNQALTSMPKSASPQFQSLIHFFNARQLQIANPVSDTTVDNKVIREIVYGYSNAIKLNPSLSLAYNNLGVLFSSLFIPSIDFWQADETRFLKEHDFGILKKESLLFDDIGSYFDMAIKHDPKIALFRANKWCFFYQVNSRDFLQHNGDRVIFLEHFLLDSLSKVAAEDPSLPGVQVALGTINFDVGNLQQALKHYQRADSIVRDSWPLKINLAQTYRRLGMTAQAIAKFKDMLSADSTDYESLLALVGTHIEAKKYSEAISYLKQYPPQEGPELILYSEVLFRQGKLNDALEVLTKSYPATPAKKDPWYQEIHDSSLEFCLIKTYNQLLKLKDEYKWRPPYGNDELFFDNYFNNYSEALTVATISRGCAQKYGEEGPWKSNCLGATPEGRLNAIFHIFHQWLARRNFLRSNEVAYDIGACPFLFSKFNDDDEWQLETTIITNMRGIEKEGISKSQLKTFSGSLLIREIEREKSFLDFIRVRLEYPDGSEKLLYPTIMTLQENDGAIIILNQGDALVVKFDDDYEKTFSKAFVEAKGYYIPVPSSKSPKANRLVHNSK